MNPSKRLGIAGFAAVALSALQGTDPAAQGRRLRQEGETAQKAFVSACLSEGITLDFAAKRLSIEASVQEGDMPIEYLLVGPRGATHETLFVSKVKPSTLVTALYALGLEPGKNVQYKDRVPAPSEAELAEGALPYEVVPPEGPGIFLYAEWKDGEDWRRYRVEDLLLNTKTGKSAARVRWVFLGSRWLKSGKDGTQSFAADLEENIVSVCYFAAGNQVLTNPDRDGQEQHLFLPNSWLLPKKGEAVRLIFSLEKEEAAGVLAR